MSRSLWRLLAAAGAAAVCAVSLAVSCAIPGFELADATSGPGSGGGGGAGAGGGDGGAGACQSIEPPLAPNHTDPGTDVDFVVAVRTLDFGEDFDPDQGPVVGYDLDARCTCLGGTPSCATVGNQPVDCDGPRGRDNAVARLFDNLGLFEPESFNSQYHSAAANMGSFGLLFRVMGYNGGQNDQDVTLAIYTSSGMDADPCASGEPPAWDGSDHWPVDALSVATGGAGGGGPGGGGAGGSLGGGGAGGCDASAPGYDVDDPIFVSQFGYVTEGILVANLPTAGIALQADDQTIALNLVGGFVTARIEQTANGYFLRSGVLTGRWRLADFFGFIGSFSASGQQICKDSALYGPIKEIVCNYADIHAEISGTAAPCDAMSFGMGFEAEPANLGNVIDTSGGNGGTSCTPEQDPAGDDCRDQG